MNLKELIGEYSNRYIAFIIYGKANIGKTLYVKRFIKNAVDLKINYINAEENIRNEKKEKEIIFYTPLDYINIIKNSANKSEIDLTIIDDLDFLFQFWSGEERRDFIHRISKIEKSVVEKPICIILQQENIIERLIEKENYKNIYKITEFIEIPS